MEAILLEPLVQGFMLRALVAGVLVACAGALLGVFIVLRGLSLVSDGLAHAAFGGIALGLVMGVTPEAALFVALPFTAAVAVAINLVRQRSAVRGDTATGVFFSVSFALAVVLISARPASAPPVNLETLLFGSILAVTPALVIALAIVAALVVACVGVLWSRLAYATFDPELAALSGVPVRALEHVLLALTAVVVVVGVRTVGVVLVSACIVVPAATARVIGGSLARMAVLAVVVGVSGTFIGLLGSYHLNVPSGAAIVLVLGAAFFAALGLGRR